jgi:hypothetical protein
MEYYSAVKKNTFESVLMRWMKLEPIIQSEVSQKEKHQYNILMHIHGIIEEILCIILSYVLAVYRTMTFLKFQAGKPALVTLVINWG